MRKTKSMGLHRIRPVDRPTRQSILASAEAVAPSTLQQDYDKSWENSYTPLNSGFTETAMLSVTVYAYVYEDEMEIIPMNRVPVGTNIRGWTFRITRMDMQPESPVDVIYSMDINGKSGWS